MCTQAIPTSGIDRTFKAFFPRPVPATHGQVDTCHCGMDTQSRPIDHGSPLLTDEEACNYLRCRQRQLYTYRMQGVIPFIRIGRSIRYRLRDLEAAIAAMTVVPLAEATRKSGNTPGQPSPETSESNINPIQQP